jgi:hypothetical protein
MPLLAKDLQDNGGLDGGVNSPMFDSVGKSFNWTRIVPIIREDCGHCLVKWALISNCSPHHYFSIAILTIGKRGSFSWKVSLTQA